MKYNTYNLYLKLEEHELEEPNLIFSCIAQIVQ